MVGAPGGDGGARDGQGQRGVAAEILVGRFFAAEKCLVWWARWALVFCII